MLQTQQENLSALMAELLRLMEGMDYCLDWKPEDHDWSVREVVYHILDTPPGGIHTVVQGLIDGSISEYEIWSDRSNVTPERSAHDMEQILVDVRQFFGGLAESLSSAAEGDLESKLALMHQRTRDEHAERTLSGVLAGFDRHWRGHLEQIAGLRNALGL